MNTLRRSDRTQRQGNTGLLKGQMNELNKMINQTQVIGLNDDELITRNKDRKYQIRAREEGKHKTRRDKL